MWEKILRRYLALVIIDHEWYSHSNDNILNYQCHNVSLRRIVMEIDIILSFKNVHIHFLYKVRGIDSKQIEYRENTFVENNSIFNPRCTSPYHNLNFHTFS